MAFIEHLLTFPNEAAAFAALEPLGFAVRNKANNLVWDTGRVDPTVRLITSDDPFETIAGFHLTISLPVASVVLEALADDVLRVIEDRDLATPSKAFHEYAASLPSLKNGVAKNLPASQLNKQAGKIVNLKFRISPRPLGSEYPEPLST